MPTTLNIKGRTLPRYVAKVSMAELQALEPSANNHKLVSLGNERGQLDTDSASISLQTGPDLPVYVDTDPQYVTGGVPASGPCQQAVTQLFQAGRFGLVG